MNTTISHKKLTLYSSVKGKKVGIRHEGVVRIFAFPIKCLLVEDLECSLQLERKTNSLSDSGIFKLDVTEPAQDPRFLLLSPQQLAFVSTYVINIEEVSLPSRTCFSDLNEKVFHPTSWIRPLKGLLLACAPPLWTCSSPFLCPLWAVVWITFLCNILVSSSLGKKELGDFGANAVMRVIWVRTLVKSEQSGHHPGLSF